MSKFLDDLKEFAIKHDYHLYRVAEIKDGEIEEIEFVPSSNCHNSYSVAKAFVVTAIGFLFDEGKIKTDEGILEILEYKGTEKAWTNFGRLTIDMALRHRIGHDWGYLDIDAGDPREFGCDYLKYVLENPPIYIPGEKYIYTDAAFYLLSRVVEKRCGEPIESYLWRKLFSPLGFAEVAWSKCPMGHAMGATGLYIRSCDMAKLGQLYLSDGVWNGRRLLSHEWIDIVLSREYEFSKLCGGIAYGKGGMCGQMLMVIPQEKRVVAWHGFDEGDFSSLIKWVCDYEG